MSLAVPTYWLKYSRDSAPGVSSNLWSLAIMAHWQYHCPDMKLYRIYTDNGLGMCPTAGHLPKPILLALLLGARVTYIPPSQPWRNGRLERFHWTMTREYWARSKPKTTEEAEKGLVDYLNWYNHHRIHSALAYQPPASCYDQKPEPLPYEFWKCVQMPESVPLTSGTIECIRLVDNEGIVTLWQRDTLRLPDVLAGQYVRVEFDITPDNEVNIGRAIWRGREELVVAHFTHTLGHGKRCETLILDHEWRDLTETPRNQAYDPLEYMHGQAQRTRKPGPKRSE
ncbi:MAG: hypothetical protein KatS3mg020_0916 [Fimbriimonadales bacterium]|nr:MAG: hypothetical protein KatS3mg020_0916 [Fimbriimonadales bacterium]